MLQVVNSKSDRDEAELYIPNILMDYLNCRWFMNLSIQVKKYSWIKLVNSQLFYLELFAIVKSEFNQWISKHIFVIF